MFGMKPITGTMVDSLLFSASLLGILLLFSTFIRVKLQFLRKYYISASLIAGLIGLILGPEVLGIIPKDIISSWGALSGRLIYFGACSDAYYRQLSETWKIRTRNRRAMYMVLFGHICPICNSLLT